ncbi:MAG: hypothetical protein CL927_06700 [Deltaproteobacteria bacterium]|nr:hypothetical protein [Deltaproteobacteria bacterium]HCH61373.1 hypothetical protein [Deltaproteobacteria bacterium]
MWVGLAVLLVFGPLVGAGYVWDDDALIVQNTALSGWKAFFSAWTGGLWDHTPQAQHPPIYYRPVMLWSLQVDHLLGGSARLAHLHSLGWHLLNVGLVAVVARRLGCSSTAAWTSAGLFGLHPVAVESVAWISARNDPMSVAAILGMLAVSLRPGSKPRLVHLAAMAAFGAAAKETAYLAPVCLAPVLWAARRPIGRPVLGALIGVSAVLIGRWLAGVAWPPGADAAHLLASAWPTSAWAMDALAMPSVRAPGGHLAWPEPIPMVGVLAGLAGGLVLLWAGRRKALGLSVLGVIGVLPAWPAVAHVGLFGDRYLLLSLAGFALAVATSLDRATRARRLRPELWLLLALPHAVTASASVTAWQDDTTLWTAAVERHENPHTAGSLAKVLELQGDLDGAAHWYSVATMAPRPLPHACWNVAAIELKRGAPADAGEVGLRALAAGCPSDPELICPTAYGLAAKGLWTAAEEVLAKLTTRGTGLCTITKLAGSARRREVSALDAAVAGESPGWTSLAERLGLLLRSGGDLETAEWVDALARERQREEGG